MFHITTERSCDAPALRISRAMQEASLEEGPVLRLILDYFERAGHAECLVSLENYCKDFGKANEVLKRSSFPLELSALRDLSLHGKWDQVVQYLNAFCGCSDKEGLERCMYLAERQKYFEILHHIENNIRSKFRLGYSFPGNGELLSAKEVERTQNLIQHQLSVLEGLSPSPEEFQLLKNLFSSSSLSSCKEFSTWQLHSGRLETFYRIGEWVSTVLYLTINFPKQSCDNNLANADSCSLLRLVAKGLLYEQCEQLCRMRCGESEKEEPPKLLDLSSWIQQQPDSSFQTAPAEIVLVVKPLKSPHPYKEMSSHNLEDDVVMENKSVQCDEVPQSLDEWNDDTVMVTETDKATAEHGDVENAAFQNVIVTETDNETAEHSEMENAALLDMVVAVTEAGKETGERSDMETVALQDAVDSERNVKVSTRNQDNQSFQQATRTNISRQRTGILEAVKTLGSEGEDDQEEATPPPMPFTSHETSSTAQPMMTSFRNKSSDCKASQAPLHSSLSSSEAQGYIAHPVTSNSSGCSTQDTTGVCDAGPSYVVSQPSAVTFMSNSSRNLPHLTSALRISSSDKPSIQDMPQSHQALMKSFDQVKHTTTTKPDKTDLKTKLREERLVQATASHAVDRQRFRTSRPRAKAKTISTPAKVIPSTSECDYSSTARDNRPCGIDTDVSRASVTGTWPAAATLLGTVTDSQVVRSVAFSESGGIVAVGANSSTLRLCSTAPLLDHHRRKTSELDVFYLSPYYHKSSIYCLSWFHDSILASGSNDQTIRLLICSHNNKITVNKPLYVHNGTVRDLAFTPDGLLVSGGGGKDLEVKVTDIMTGQSMINLAGHTDQILAVETLANGLVMSGGQDKMVFVWDLRSQNPASKTCLTSPVTSLTTCGEGLVAGHVNGSCSVLDKWSYQCTTTYTAHRGECRTVQACPVHPNRGWVLSGSYDGTVCLANVAPAMTDATERVQWTEMCKHRDKIIQCRWHPQGQLFASTGADKKACFWHI